MRQHILGTREAGDWVGNRIHLLLLQLIINSILFLSLIISGAFLSVEHPLGDCWFEGVSRKGVAAPAAGARDHHLYWVIKS